MAVRLFYVDDSGARDTGFVTYSWIEMLIDDWRGCLATLIAWRRGLWSTEQIPVEFEFHATKFLNGRMEPSKDPAWYGDKRGNARRVAEDGLATLAAMAPVTFGTVYRQVPASDRHWAAQRAGVYEAMLIDLDARLQAAGDLGIVIMDGNGTDPSYRRAHRQLKLATRAIIEDPAFQPAHESQLVQMADLVAYVSYQHLLQHPNRQYGQSWYPTHLAAGHGGQPTPV